MAALIWQFQNGSPGASHILYCYPSAKYELAFWHRSAGCVPDSDNYLAVDLRELHVLPYWGCAAIQQTDHL